MSACALTRACNISGRAPIFVRCKKTTEAHLCRERQGGRQQKSVRVEKNKKIFSEHDHQREESILQMLNHKDQNISWFNYKGQLTSWNPKATSNPAIHKQH